MPGRAAIGGVLCLLVAAALATRASPYVLVCGSLIDVRNGSNIGRRYVSVSNGRITAVSATDPGSGPGEHVDLGAYTCLPGLVDTHVHMFLREYNIASWTDQVTKESLVTRSMRAAQHAKTTLLSGFTLVRDLGTEGALDADYDLRTGIEQGWLEGPRLLIGSRAIVSTGGYAPKGFVDHDYTAAERADGVDEMRRVVRRQLNIGGADWIKLYGDYSRVPGGPAKFPLFSAEEFEAAVQEAAEADVRVAVHSKFPEATQRAVRAGAKSIEHGTHLDDETLNLMRSFNVSLVSTLSIYEMSASSGDPEDIAEFEAVKESFRRAVQLGLSVLCGSDAGGVAHGASAREIELMSQNGMDYVGAIRAATLNAASFLLPSEHIGVIEVGALADVIAVQGNPLADIAALRNVAFVMKDGAIYRNDA